LIPLLSPVRDALCGALERKRKTLVCVHESERVSEREGECRERVKERRGERRRERSA
jgi:hypothetical protein